MQNALKFLLITLAVVAMALMSFSLLKLFTSGAEEPVKGLAGFFGSLLRWGS